MTATAHAGSGGKTIRSYYSYGGMPEDARQHMIYDYLRINTSDLDNFLNELSGKVEKLEGIVDEIFSAIDETADGFGGDVADEFRTAVKGYAESFETLPAFLQAYCDMIQGDIYDKAAETVKGISEIIQSWES